MQKADCLYVDGTFRTAPKPYTQFISVHGKISGFVIPLAFILVTGKSTAQYVQILQHLKQEVIRLTNNPLNPGRIILDFEMSMMNALQMEFPTSALSGCYFHFNQSLWRHIQQIGLARDYQQDRRLNKVIRRVMAIGFLPTLLV
jgi:hypothetical protein